MSNTYAVCQEWRIADINHDNIAGVDLVSKYVIGQHASDGGNIDYINYIPFDKSSEYNIYYDSGIRKVLNGTDNFFGGFTSEVQNALKSQPITLDFYAPPRTDYDKVKLVSTAEVGNVPTDTSDGYYSTGYIYPLFGNSIVAGNQLSIFSDNKGTGRYYLTRDRCFNKSRYIWCISPKAEVLPYPTVSNCPALAFIKI